MQPHQQRVVDEKSELDEKLGKLSVFIESSPIFTRLDDKEKSRLIAQKAHMEGYSDILGERIAAFGPEQPISTPIHQPEPPILQLVPESLSELERPEHDED